MEMAALEAQRVAEATEAALDSDDDLELLRIADSATQQEVSTLPLLGLAPNMASHHLQVLST